MIISIAHSTLDRNFSHVLSFLPFLPDIKHARTFGTSKARQGLLASEDRNVIDETAQLTIAHFNLLWAVISHPQAPSPAPGTEWEKPPRSVAPFLGFTSVEYNSSEAELRKTLQEAHGKEKKGASSPTSNVPMTPALSPVTDASGDAASVSTPCLSDEEMTTVRDQTRRFVSGLCVEQIHGM